MAHTVLGIDLGSYAVKLAHLEAGFRSLRLLALHQRALLPPLAPSKEGEPPEPLLSRQARTARALCDELGLQPEMTAAALGEQATLRVLTLPLEDPRKVEQVLPFELEGQLLGDIEEHVVDHTIAQGGLVLDPDSPQRGCRLVAAAAPRAEVEALLHALGAVGLDPRLVGAGALSCAALFTQPGAVGPLPAAVLDLGHRRSHFLCIGQQEGRGPAATFARTIARGGLHLTQALARAHSIPEETAERLKLAADIDLSPGPAGRTDPRVSGPLREALRPLVRDLRQTLASYTALYGDVPQRLWLVGGGARLRGLPALLTEELGLPVAPLPPPESLVVRTAESDAVFPGCAPALGLALSVAGPAPQVNFRKGELAYRTDYSFLRERASQLGLMAAAVLLCAGLSALASLRTLQKESERLSAVLRNETMQLFGEARSDGAAVSAELSSVIAGARGGERGIPSTSAFDLLDEISRAAPPQSAGKGTVDITELHIRPKKTELKGTASSAQYVDDFAAALGKIPCFKEVEKGKVVTVKNTGPDGKPVDAKQFSISIESTCP